jgi:hypothetical protein
LRLSFLYGIPFGRWMQLLWENGFRVSPRYAGRAARITAFSVLSSGFRLLESVLCKTPTEIPSHPPLFVLGHWRSGTTWLHYLLTQDQRFAFPTVFDTAYPHSFLLWPDKRRAILEPLVENKRPQDNIHVDLGSASEDDMAMAVLSGRAFYNAWSFPAHYDRYQKGLSFRDVPAGEVEKWKAHHTSFHERLLHRYRKPMVFKSPGHTARMALLLKMYPDARFVHITRHPYDLVRSNLFLFGVWKKHYAFLQAPDLSDLEGRILASCRSMYDAFYEDLPTLPEGRICHLKYEDLETDPMGEMARIYEELGLPDFEAARPGLQTYVDTLVDYRKNELPPLADDFRERIRIGLGREMRKWGYMP